MQLITRYFPELSSLQIFQFSKLFDLYCYWNEKINVISRKDIDNLYEHHVLHSLSIAKIIQFKNKTSIMDVGTGGGFPGIPLAIMFPGVNFYLIDSIGKKIKVVKEVCQELKLTNVFAEQKRAEEVNKKFDFIVSRAVTSLPKFLPWVINNIKTINNNKLKNGILYIKGGDISEELKQVKHLTTIYSLSNFFTEPFFESKAVIFIPIGK